MSKGHLLHPISVLTKGELLISLENCSPNFYSLKDLTLPFMKEFRLQTRDSSWALFFFFSIISSFSKFWGICLQKIQNLATSYHLYCCGSNVSNYHLFPGSLQNAITQLISGLLYSVLRVHSLPNSPKDLLRHKSNPLVKGINYFLCLKPSSAS